MPDVLPNLTGLVEWVSAAHIPIRNEAGDLVVWDDAADEFVPVTDADRTSFYLGEIGTANVSVRSNLSAAEQRLSANMLSQVTLEVADPGLVMYEKGYFMLDRTMVFNGLLYKVTAVAVHYKFDKEIVGLTGQAYNGARLMSDKGAANFGAISPTAFAQAKAGEFGMNFIGEASAGGDPILRRQEDDTDESTWDVLKRLANEKKFNLFEANNTLYFASDEYIVENTDVETLKVPSLADSAAQILSVDVRMNTTDDFAANADIRFAKNSFSTALQPGHVIQFEGLGSNDGPLFMVENVTFGLEADSQVRVTTRSAKETAETTAASTCSTQTFARGATGDCVRRIQTAVGAGVDGIFGPITERRVRVFQESRGVAVTGVVNAETWAKIELAS